MGLKSSYRPSTALPSKTEMASLPDKQNGLNGKSTEESNREQSEYKLQPVWPNVFAHFVIHCIAVYGITVASWSCKWITILSVLPLAIVSVVGITAGPHRLWSHRSYTARLPLRIFLAIVATYDFQNSIYVWCRDHRAHHKYTDTNADPHNAKRGFFFSHMGWLMVKKHPDVIKKGGGIDCSDLLKDPVVYYQHKYYYQLSLFITFLIPTYLPHYLWGETLWNSFVVMTVTRLVLSYHITWCVNSVAHIWGNRPYDETIDPAENKMVSFFTMGEGWHNYHHVFPFDYRASEFRWMLNPTTQFIELMSLIGQAQNLKSVSSDLIKARAQKTGNGTLYAKLNGMKTGLVDAGDKNPGYTYDF